MLGDQDRCIAECMNWLGLFLFRISKSHRLRPSISPLDNSIKRKQSQTLATIRQSSLQDLDLENGQANAERSLVNTNDFPASSLKHVVI